MSRTGKSLETESRLVQDLGQEGMGVTAIRYEDSFWSDKNVLELKCGDYFTTF